MEEDKQDVLPGPTNLSRSPVGRGELAHVEIEVDPDLEIGALCQKVCPEDGPALFLERVKGTSIRFVTNVFGSRRRTVLPAPVAPYMLFGKETRWTPNSDMGWISPDNPFTSSHWKRGMHTFDT